MRITILNGNPDPGNSALDGYLQELAARLAPAHTVTPFVLRDLEVKDCLGCFGCWVKTPGECVVPDATRDIRRATMNSDFLLMASPVTMGFASALLKRATDKLIPILLPYMAIDQGEFHHRARYRRYPLLGLLLQPAADTTDQDLALISHVYSRTALNMKSRLAFTQQTAAPVEEVAHAFDRL